MKFTIFFVRHGQTTSNRDGILQGQSDSDLTELGVNDAQTAGELLRGITWDVVLTSDLGRAFNTAQHIKNSSQFDNRIVPTPFAREICFGIRNGLPVGLTVAQAKQIIAKKSGIAVEDVEDNAETSLQVHERQKELLFEILQQLTGRASQESIDFEYHPLTTGTHARRVLVVSHGGFIKNFLSSRCGMTGLAKIRNGSVSVVNIHWNESDGSFHCVNHEQFINHVGDR